MKKHTCPVCGYDQLESKPYRNMPPISKEIYQVNPPYHKYWGTGSYEVCSCCGFEFGFDDDGIFPENNSTFQNYLQEWIERDNAKWFEPELRPRDWDLEAQLSKAGIPIPQISQKLLSMPKSKSEKD